MTDASPIGWYGATAAGRPELRVLAGDVDADVCVIGGGIAGLTIARLLAARDWSVVLLEAERIGAGTSGAGFGLVTPGFSEPIDRMTERLGLDDAKAVWRLSAAAVDAVRSIIAEEGMSAAMAVDGHLAVQLHDDSDAAQERAAFLRQMLATDAEFWSTERVREVSRSGLHHQAVYLPKAFHLHPLNFLFGLAAAARKAGVRIYEQSPVRALDATGIRRRIELEGGRVRARHVVLAASAGNQALHPALAGTMLTLRQPLGVTEPLGDRLGDALSFTGAITQQGTRGRSHRLVGGDRLLWSGPLTTSARAIGAGALRRQIRGVYGQLGNAAVAEAWVARADFAVHRMPQIGELSPGLWVAAAFGRQNIAAATMAATLIADAIHTRDDRWRLFQPYGLVWTGGQLGRALAGALLRTSRLRLRLRDMRAQGFREQTGEVPSEVAPTELASAGPVPATPAYDGEADVARRTRARRRRDGVLAAALQAPPHPLVEVPAAEPERDEAVATPGP